MVRISYSCLWCIFLCILLALPVSVYTKVDADEDDEDPFKTTDPKKREPSPCEICKYFVTELKSRLAETDKSKEVIETGHGLDRKKRFKYRTSELRLTEALHEPHICENILTYNVHAERKGSLRYAKGQSETMSTLHGLVNKGVKVELGIPYELWDKPSAEVSKMHRSCFTFAERYEETIEDWYYNLQDTEDLMRYLCAERFLKDKDQNCLKEVFEPKGDKGDGEAKKRKKKSGKKKKDKQQDTTSHDATGHDAQNEKPEQVPSTSSSSPSDTFSSPSDTAPQEELRKGVKGESQNIPGASSSSKISNSEHTASRPDNKDEL